MTNNYNASATSSEYRFAGYRLDVRRKKLFNPEGGLVVLSARPFDALLALVARRGDIVSREELMEAVWPGVFVEENNLSQAVSTVRKALNDTTSESLFIRTVPGRGYSFITPVEVFPENGREHRERRVEELAASGVARSGFRASPLQGLAVALILVVGMLVFWYETQDSRAVLAPGDVPAPLGISDIPPPDSRIRNSIAVLPLATLGEDTDVFFAAGLHDEIISQLTQIRSLSVIARSSIVTLLDQGLSTLDATRVLRVESILSGTIRPAGTQARINLELVDVRTGVTLWSGAYDINRRDLTEMISVQSDIALNVAAALKAELPPQDTQDIAALPTELFRAYRFHLAARDAHDHQNYAGAWRLARKAIELDPQFYEAIYSFASANLILAGFPLPGMTRLEHNALALEHAGRLIELAPERSEGYAVQAVALAMRKDWSGVATALDALEEMQAPLPSLEYVAPVAMSLGDFDKAIAVYEANLLTEVINPYARGFLMVALELDGQRENARSRYDTGQELFSQWWGNAVNVMLALGRNEPLGDLDHLVGISDDLRQALRQHGDRSAVLAAITAYRAAPEKKSHEALYYAALAADLEEHDLAVALLQTSMEDVWNSIFWVWLPVFDGTRQQESFRELLRESGLVDHWQVHGWPPTCQPFGAGDFRCDWRAYPAPSTASR